MSKIYVLLDRTDYIDKIDRILSDESKFRKIRADPTADNKKEANRLIDSANAHLRDAEIKRIIGEYEPGYIYGNVKIHKPNKDLRPIISQIPTPTYELSKYLNNLISPYIPYRYSIQSTVRPADLSRK